MSLLPNSAYCQFPSELFRVRKKNHLYIVSRHARAASQLRCFQVQESSSGSSGLLPQYSCLVVSPALIWHRDPQRFLQDPHIFDSLFGLRETKELFFGLPWRETGLRKSSDKNQHRVLSYAVSLLLEKYDTNYIKSLEDALVRQFPLSRIENTSR